MIAIRPNLTRKQMAMHAGVAGAMSWFLTAPVIRIASGFGWLELENGSSRTCRTCMSLWHL